MKYLALLLVLLVPLVAFGQTDPLGTTRGYQGRANGMDLDQDGVVGEAGVDDIACDSTGGSTSGENKYEEDLVGDASLEEQIFIDLDGGTDSATCGTPGSPCLTLSHVATTRGDGPGDGQADWWCIKGTGAPDDVSITSGVTGTYTRTKSGNEVADATLPSEPAVVMGWDNDGDNSYPPFDTDDTAVLDGTTISNLGPLDTQVVHYWELAHFTVDDYDAPSNQWTFVSIKDTDYTYVHDIVLTDMDNTVSGATSRMITVGGSATHNYFENIQVESGGAFVFRGNYDAGTQGPLWLKNWSYTGDTQPDQQMDFWDMWGNLVGGHILDSVIDANVAAWDSTPTQRLIGFQFDNCVQDIYMVNSKIIGYSEMVQVRGGSTSFCSNPGQITCDPCVFDKNEFVFNTDWPSSHNQGISFGSAGGDENKRIDGDLKVTNNVFYNVLPAELEFSIRDFRSKDGSGYTGTLYIVNNTIVSTDSDNITRAQIWLDDVGTFIPQNYVIKNNVINFGSDTGRDNIRTDWAPTGWDADFNIYDANAEYEWAGGGTVSTLTAWQSASSDDASSDECVPTWEDGANHDFHLAVGDTCAKENATALPAILTQDYDGQDRSSPWDAGADENSDAGGDPSPPASPDQGVNFTGVSKTK
jgi:hypothetical protein